MRISRLLFKLSIDIFWYFSFAALATLIVLSPLFLLAPLLAPAALFFAIAIPLSILSLGVTVASALMLGSLIAAGISRLSDYFNRPSVTAGNGASQPRYMPVAAAAPAAQVPQQQARGMTMFEPAPAPTAQNEESASSNLKNKV